MKTIYTGFKDSGLVYEYIYTCVYQSYRLFFFRMTDEKS